MIVSGGENASPREVEEAVAGLGAVLEAAAIGVDDPKFGQRLRLFVVLRDGHEMGGSRSRTTFGPTWPVTKCRERSCSSNSYPATRRARS